MVFLAPKGRVATSLPLDSHGQSFLTHPVAFIFACFSTVMKKSNNMISSDFSGVKRLFCLLVEVFFFFFFFGTKTSRSADSRVHKIKNKTLRAEKTPLHYYCLVPTSNIFWRWETAYFGRWFRAHFVSCRTASQIQKFLALAITLTSSFYNHCFLLWGQLCLNKSLFDKINQAMCIYPLPFEVNSWIRGHVIYRKHSVNSA